MYMIFFIANLESRSHAIDIFLILLWYAPPGAEYKKTFTDADSIHEGLALPTMGDRSGPLRGRADEPISPVSDFSLDRIGYSPSKTTGVYSLFILRSCTLRAHILDLKNSPHQHLLSKYTLWDGYYKQQNEGRIVSTNKKAALSV
jgi:hypothetical protein